MATSKHHGAFCAALMSLVIMVTGCSAPLIAPSKPKPADVRSYFIELENARVESSGDDAGIEVSPRQYTKTAYVLVERKCDDFFDDLIALQNDIGFARDEITLGAATAAGILLALEESATVLGILALGAAALEQSISNYEKYYAFAGLGPELRVLVFKALNTYEAGAPPENFSTMPEADAAVRGYASLCTLSKITEFARAAIKAGDPENTNSRKVSVFSIEETQLLTGAFAGVGINGLSDGQVILVHWFVNEGGNADKEAREYIIGELANGVISKLLKGSSEELQDSSEVQQLFRTLDLIASNNPKFQAAVDSHIANFKAQQSAHQEQANAYEADQKKIEENPGLTPSVTDPGTFTYSPSVSRALPNIVIN